MMLSGMEYSPRISATTCARDGTGHPEPDFMVFGTTCLREEPRTPAEKHFLEGEEARVRKKMIEGRKRNTNEGLGINEDIQQMRQCRDK